MHILTVSPEMDLHYDEFTDEYIVVSEDGRECRLRDDAAIRLEFAIAAAMRDGLNFDAAAVKAAQLFL